MANRFSRLIGEGEISSVEELKTAFKDLAKRTHPDLAEGDGDAEAFVRVRRDYEAALLELSAPRPASRAEAPQPAAGAGAAAGAGGAEGAAAGDAARRLRHPPKTRVPQATPP